MKSKSVVVAAMAIGVVLLIAGPASAQRYMEKLDRGLVAVKSGSGYFLSWRLFGTDPQDTTFGFNVYRGTTKLNSAVITDSTNYTDSAGGSGTYTVKAVTNGVEGETSAPALVIDSGYVNIPLKPPAAGSSHGSSYTETANDASIGDLDGDGQYEIVLKWDPSNSKDNASQGYTGPTYLDGYKLDGTQLWRISLGQNIRSGAHYTQFMVYDLDGDGSAEVACKTAPGTKDGTGNYLKTGPAATADHTIDYTSTDTATQGKVITGPEYYTIFSGKTGAELVTVDYKPGRGAEGVWGAIQGIATPAGDLGWGNDSNYNFVDRFLASVAYLDGERPSVIPCRGYYWRSALWALDWRDGKLTERWLFDTAAVPGAKGKDGKPLQSSQGYESQGAHSLRQGDVDGDGFDEIVYGSATIDHDGQGLYSTGLRHGDALHMSDLMPDRPGLEIWMADEQSSENGGIVSHFQDATDGTIIWQQTGSGDNGRGCTGPLLAGTKGWQMWSGAGGLFDGSQKTVGSVPSSDNFTIWWGADLTRFLLNGTSISPYSGGGTGLNASGCTSNNSTKSTPALTADIFGDWREEVVFRTTGNDALRIYTTSTPTTKRLYTLMHDPIYRMSVATENVAYNQPPEPGIYIGPSMTLPETPPKIKYYGTGPITSTGGSGAGGTGAGGAGGTGGIGAGGGGGGGVIGSGGAASGGTIGSGGRSNGGVIGSGGGAVSGGTIGSGGAANGGTIGSGGVSNGGGVIGSGGAGSGGVIGSGGARSGGVIATGGTPGSGGATSGSGGATSGSGGAGGTGGAATSAASASGGAATTGGTGTGGASSTGGSTGNTQTTGATAASGNSGCSCRLAGVDRSATPWGVMLVFGAMLASRLRRRGVRQRRSP
jgi:rhamnogalacturonan endolyase